MMLAASSLDEIWGSLTTCRLDFPLGLRNIDTTFGNCPSTASFLEY